MAPVEQSTSSRRERVRAATIDEIKATALALMRESGSSDLRFADIARALGMTGPALYRYFADRDELLTALIVDGFEDFGVSLHEALASAPTDDVEARLTAAASAYRRWAVSDPPRFALVFGAPVPGFVRAHEGPILEATRAALGNFQEIVRGAALRPLVADVADLLAHEIGAMAAAHERQASPQSAEVGRPIAVETYQALLHSWAAMHGFACLEAFGHLDWMSAQARDELFRSQLDLLARALGTQPAQPE